MFIITGILIGILFDFFRILRRSFKTADVITYLQDILFWILAGFILLFSIFKFNHGEIRSYLFLGIALGLLFYMFTLSKFIIKYVVVIITKIKKIVSYPIHWICQLFNTLFFNPITKLLKMTNNLLKSKEKNMKIPKKTKVKKKLKKNQINLKKKEDF